MIALAPKHKGMYVSLGGCLSSTGKFAREELKRHIELMGVEYYKGNTEIVDKFLQLYCISENEREEAIKENQKVKDYELGLDLENAGLQIANTHLQEENERIRESIERAVSFGWDCGHYGKPCDAREYADGLK